MSAPPVGAAAASRSTRASARKQREEESKEEEKATLHEYAAAKKTKRGNRSDNTAAAANASTAAARLSPAQRCCNDQIHVLLSFLPMKDVLSAAQSCQIWLSAASSAPSHQWSVTGFPGFDARALASSRLRYHVSQIEGSEWFDANQSHCFSVEELDALHTLPSLTAIRAHVRAPSDDAAECKLRLSPRLERLALRLSVSNSTRSLGSEQVSRAKNRLLSTLRSARSVRSLTLESLYPAVDLSFLTSMLQLTHLDLRQIHLSDANIDSIRSVPLQTLHVRRYCNGGADWTTAQLQRLLQPPCRLQLRHLFLHHMHMDRAQLALLLPFVDTLEDLSPHTLASNSFDLLPRFSKLRSLSLSCPAQLDLDPVDLSLLLPNLAQCHALRQLTLGCARFAPGQLRALLRALPLLTSLALHACSICAPDEFADSPGSLERLRLANCRLKCSILRHLSQVASLRHLSLDNTFSETVDSCTLALLRSPQPSRLFPHLHSCQLTLGLDEE